MIKYFIWDFDGVICDSADLAFEIHNEICNYYTNLPKVSNCYDYANLIQGGYDESLMKYLSKEQLNDYFYKHREKIYEKRNELKLFLMVIEDIKNNKIPSIIITSTYEKVVKDVLQNNGYKLDLFKEVIGREKKGSKAEKLIELCKRLNIQLNEIIYIGDSLSDVDFCNKLGVNIIAVSYGYCPKEVFKNKNVLKLCNNEIELIDYINVIRNEEGEL